MLTPAVSIIIPTKNRRHFLGATLDSLARQSLPNWQALIVDDGSSDDTAAFLAARAAADPRIHYFQRDRQPEGAPTCRNIGLHHAAAPTVLFLDSDDLLAPDCLRGRLAALHANPDADFVVANGEIFHDAPGDLARFWSTFDSRSDLDRFLQGDAVWATPGALWRSEKLRAIGGWTEGLARWQDWELHIRALCRQLRYHKLPVADFHVRRHCDQAISASDHEAQGLAQRMTAMARAMTELRGSPLASPARHALLATLAFDHFVLLRRQSRAAAKRPWKTFRTARGRRPSDLLFTALTPLLSSTAPESLLPQRLFRRWNRTPKTSPNRLHCNATHITFPGDASTLVPALPA